MSKPANQLWKRDIPSSYSISPTTFRSCPLLTLPVSNRFRCSQLADKHYRAVGCGVELDTFWLRVWDRSTDTVVLPLAKKTKKPVGSIGT